MHEVVTLKRGTSPYNNRIELIARGRHVFRLRESRAGSPPAAGLPPSACGPCSQFIRTLYGRYGRLVSPISIVLSFFWVQLGLCQVPDTAVFKTKSSVNTIKVSKDWVPKNLDECFKRLDEILPDSVRQEMKAGTEKDMGRYHHGFGTHLRNSWGLWKGGPLKKYFNGLGILHPDDMSGIILDSYWRKLNGRPILLNDQTQFYKNNWKVSKGPKWYEPKLCPDTIQEVGSFCFDEEVFKGVCRRVFIGYCNRKLQHLAYEWNRGWYKADSSMINRLKNE